MNRFQHSRRACETGNQKRETSGAQGDEALCVFESSCQNIRLIPTQMAALDPTEGEGDVDREIRVEKMKRELEELAGGPMITGSLDDVPAGVEEMFLERACEFEKASWDTNLNRLIQLGVEMVPPAELDDTTLSAKLDEVLRSLAAIHCFLHDTNHLSERELYTWLWSDGLREETPDLSQLGGAWHTSPIGSCTDEDTAIFLKYYASNKERRQWKKDFPNDPLPPHCPLPYNRDHNLPHSE